MTAGIISTYASSHELVVILKELTIIEFQEVKCNAFHGKAFKNKENL